MFSTDQHSEILGCSAFCCKDLRREMPSGLGYSVGEHQIAKRLEELDQETKLCPTVILMGCPVSTHP